MGGSELSGVLPAAEHGRRTGSLGDLCGLRGERSARGQGLCVVDVDAVFRAAVGGSVALHLSSDIHFLVLRQHEN